MALGGLGLLVSLGGFWIAIAQIRKTTGAAEASAMSAAATLASVREMQLRDSLGRLVSLSRDIESTRIVATQRRLVSDWLDSADTALALADRGTADVLLHDLHRCRELMRDAKTQLWSPASMKKPELRTAILDVAGEARRLAITRLSSAPNSDGGTHS